MSKYIDKDKVLEYIIFKVVGKDITCGELTRGIESLPTIEVSDDAVSRRAAIEAIEKAYCNPCKERGDDYNGVRCRACNFDDAINQIDALPPVEPKRPKGEWIFNPKDAIDLMFTKLKCSECGFESADGGNFCSNCGVYMKGDTKNE